jgi:hypothetical protein
MHVGTQIAENPLFPENMFLYAIQLSNEGIFLWELRQSQGFSGLRKLTE